MGTQLIFMHPAHTGLTALATDYCTEKRLGEVHPGQNMLTGGCSIKTAQTASYNRGTQESVKRLADF